MNYLTAFSGLVLNETKLQYYEMKQYWFETVTSIVVMCAVFVGLFYGVKSFVADPNTSLDGLVFGFLLWSFATGAYSAVTKSLIEDNQKGFIEQLFLTPMGFTGLMLARVLVELMSTMVFMSIMAWITMTLTGNWLNLNFLHFFSLLLLAAPSLIGLGFVISGLALLYKRVETVGAVLNIGFMGLVAVDALPLNLFSLLPFTAGASLARDVVLQGNALDMGHLGIVLVNSLVYLLAGLFIFKRLEQRAKRLNLIGQY